MSTIDSEIRAFEALPNPGKFRAIHRTMVAKALRERKKEPWLIDQGDSSLCGPAALMFHLASEDFDTYARYVMDLYDAGVGRIGKMKVKPSRSCRDYMPGAHEIHAVDWIALASLRDSENRFRDYDDVGDKVPGITDPDMLAKWYRKAGWPEAGAYANWFTVRPLSQLIDCDFWFAKGHKVSIFTKGTLVKTGGPDFWDLTMDPTGRVASHWVVLTSRIRLDNTRAAAFNDYGEDANDLTELYQERCEFDVYTWGGTRTISLPTHIVLSYFHGAVIT